MRPVGQLPSSGFLQVESCSMAAHVYGKAVGGAVPAVHKCSHLTYALLRGQLPLTYRTGRLKVQCCACCGSKLLCPTLSMLQRIAVCTAFQAHKYKLVQYGWSTTLQCAAE